MVRKFLLLTMMLSILGSSYGVFAENKTPTTEELKCILSGICPEDEKSIIKVGKVTRVEGEVTIRHADGSEEPLTPGMEIKTHDVIDTSFESAVDLDFGYGSVTVFQFTRFRIDESINEANIQKTRMHLLIGSLEFKLRDIEIKNHTNAIRGDFSVTTNNPVNITSVRDSAMVVSIKDQFNTTVYVTEDKAYVKTATTNGEIELLEGQKITYNSYGVISGGVMQMTSGDVEKRADPFIALAAKQPQVTTSANVNSSRGSFKTIMIIVGILIVVGLGVVVVKKRS